jgi:hypothetical protein
MSIKILKYKGEVGYIIYRILYEFYFFVKYKLKSDKKFIISQFKYYHGYEIDIKQPRSLNEKINWLKLYFNHHNETIFADKILVREIIKEKFGEQFLIPLVAIISDYRDLNEYIIPDYPVIIKANHNSGSFKIIRNKNQVNWNLLRTDCRFWLSINYYWIAREKQYKKIIPKILVEKLLLTKDGKIPYDYKLNCLNGKVEFIYVSIDREGVNKRNIYNRNWEPLNFTWAGKHKDRTNLRGEEIPMPSGFIKMVEIAESIAHEFPYIRVDFYDVDGSIFFGEITQHHGGGFDQIYPQSWDLKYGDILKLATS